MVGKNRKERQLGNVICAECGAPSEKMYCTNACKQRAYREREAEKREHYNAMPDEPAIPLNEYQSNRIAHEFRLRKKYLPDDIPEDEKNEIVAGPRWWLVRWSRSLESYGLMDGVRGLIYNGRESDFESKFRTSRKFRAAVERAVETNLPMTTRHLD